MTSRKTENVFSGQAYPLEEHKATWFDHSLISKILCCVMISDKSYHILRFLVSLKVIAFKRVKLQP